MTFVMRLVRKVAHAGRADFGMCLISCPTSCGCLMASAGADLVDTDEATTVAVLSAVVVATDGGTAVAADWTGVDD